MRALFAEPACREKKPPFSSIPADILKKIADLAGAPVIAGDTAFGGLSAAAGFILTLKSGRRIFVKGSHPDEMAHGTLHLREEVQTYKTVPALQQVAPRLIGVAGDGDEDGWLLGVWEAVDHGGSPRIRDAIELMAQWQRAPLPPDALVPAVRHNYLRFFLDGQRKWVRLRDEEKVRQKFTALFAEPRHAEEWLGRNLDALIALQSLRGLSSPTGLLHGDLRLDNFLFAADRTYVVDWPNTARGPLVFDVLFFFSSLEGLGYGSIDAFLQLYKEVSGTAFAETDVDMMLAALSGFFADQAGRAVPDKLPRLRWMQKCMLSAQLNMLARREVVDSIPQMADSRQTRE